MEIRVLFEILGVEQLEDPFEKEFLFAGEVDVRCSVEEVPCIL